MERETVTIETDDGDDSDGSVYHLNGYYQPSYGEPSDRFTVQQAFVHIDEAAYFIDHDEIPIADISEMSDGDIIFNFHHTRGVPVRQYCDGDDCDIDHHAYERSEHALSAYDEWYPKDHSYMGCDGTIHIEYAVDDNDDGDDADDS